MQGQLLRGDRFQPTLLFDLIEQSAFDETSGVGGRKRPGKDRQTHQRFLKGGGSGGKHGIQHRIQRTMLFRQVSKVDSQRKRFGS